ncbi:hypothetical protein Golax_010582 [Gossypium laxum]|uniref:Uncharacterized protein n=1 Tax=Gossypium laxum TaxID=34288 RepID=A0A7J8ZHS3_9ROSI|nr:hypothetical protein [Gossypium laxum]
MQLQLGLPVDGSVLTESAQSADWGATCYDLLGAILDNIYRGQIEIGWLRDIFQEPEDDSTEVERIRYAQRWLLKLVDFRATSELSWGFVVLSTLYGEMCQGIPTALEDLRLLLDQQSEAHNSNVWHVRVPLVIYATVKMHQMDRVLRQFKFRQQILVALEVLDKEHKINLRRPNMHWPVLFSEYIEIWENWYHNIPTREPIIIPELAC